MNEFPLPKGPAEFHGVNSELLRPQNRERFAVVANEALREDFRAIRTSLMKVGRLVYKSGELVVLSTVEKIPAVMAGGLALLSVYMLLHPIVSQSELIARGAELGTIVSAAWFRETSGAKELMAGVIAGIGLLPLAAHASGDEFQEVSGRLSGGVKSIFGKVGFPVLGRVVSKVVYGK